MLCFAYGMGAILVIVGTFSGVLVRLPKSGNWMVAVKKICGIILVAMGTYLIFKAVISLW